MKHFVFAFYNAKGRRLGTIDFGDRESAPSKKEISEAAQDSFCGVATTWEEL